jgi:hypothetical protein
MAKGILRIYKCRGRYQGHVLPLQSNDESRHCCNLKKARAARCVMGPWYDDRIAVRRLGLGRKLTDPGDSLLQLGERLGTGKL